MSRIRRLPAAWQWALIAGLVVVSLAAGAQRPAAAPSAGQRAAAIDAQLACPVCQGESIAASSPAVARTMRADVLARVRAGRSSAAIEGYFVARYGPGIILRPPVAGLSALVWIVPVVVVGAAGAVLAVTLRRRSRVAPEPPGGGDEELVAGALAARRAGGGPVGAGVGTGVGTGAKR